MINGKKLTAFVVALAVMFAGIVVFDPASAASKSANMKKTAVSASNTTTALTKDRAKAKESKKYRLVKTIKIYQTYKLKNKRKNDLKKQYSFKYNKRKDPIKIVFRDYVSHYKRIYKFKYTYVNGKKTHMTMSDSDYCKSSFEYDENELPIIANKINDRYHNEYNELLYEDGYVTKNIFHQVDYKGEWVKSIYAIFSITKNKNGFPKKIVVYDPDFPKVKMAAHFYKNGLLKKDNRGKEWCKTKYHYKKGLVTKVTRKTNVVGNYIYKIKYAKPKINKKRYAFMINWMFTTNNMNICWDPITQINPLDFSWF